MCCFPESTNSKGKMLECFSFTISNTTFVSSTSGVPACACSELVVLECTMLSGFAKSPLLQGQDRHRSGSEDPAWGWRLTSTSANVARGPEIERLVGVHDCPHWNFYICACDTECGRFPLEPLKAFEAWTLLDASHGALLKRERGRRAVGLLTSCSARAHPRVSRQGASAASRRNS